MRNISFRLTIISAVLLLSTCNLPRPGLPFPSANATVESKEPTHEYVSNECAFVWAYDPLPELSHELDQALKEIPGAEGYAKAYGENCVRDSGEVVRFLAMETDFYISLQVEGLEDKQVLGELITQVFNVLEEFPTEETPGPQPGYIGITFETPDDSLRIWVKRTEVEIALKRGLNGEALFNTIQIK